jgi:Phosphatidylinositol-specific phospholipase C, X domain./Ricin-type beta-trefoil lectin domain.
MLVAAIPPHVHAAGNNWMATQLNSVRLSQMSIPGTHDSGALYEPIGGTAKCQNLTIAQQLNAGVRFLDIRCRHIDNAFTIHHGSIYQNANFDDVLNAVIGFLNANPTETVIMSVKEEHTPSNNTRSFEQTFDWYVSKNPGKWHLGSAIPKLSDVRGKIVLFRRFGAGSTPKGIDASNWPDNTTFSNGQLRIQDQYNVSNNNNKWDAITSMFEEARTGPEDVLYVNFTSGVRSGIFGIPDIPAVSNDINNRLSNWLPSNTNRRYGIVVMDFADATKCNLILNGSALHFDGTFMIVNQHTGKTLDLIGGNTAEGAYINQWQYDYNGPNQRWMLVPTEGSNRFLLHSWVSRKAASIAGGSTADGARLVSSTYTGNDTAQQWEFVDVSDGWFYIRNVKSGKVLEVAGGSTSNDAPIQQATANGSAIQKFRLQPWGDYFIQADSGKYICVEGMSSSNGAFIIQYTKENNPWFKWRFESVGQGHLKVSSLHALSRVLCVVGAGTANGDDCHLWDYNPSNIGDQKVRLIPKPNGRFKFYFLHTGKTWDIPGGATGNNVRLEQYTDNANAWQEFRLQRVR